MSGGIYFVSFGCEGNSQGCPSSLSQLAFIALPAKV
jgi:hypothetical protein